MAAIASARENPAAANATAHFGPAIDLVEPMSYLSGDNRISSCIVNEWYVLSAALHGSEGLGELSGLANHVWEWIGT